MVIASKSGLSSLTLSLADLQASQNQKRRIKSAAELCSVNVVSVEPLRVSAEMVNNSANSGEKSSKDFFNFNRCRMIDLALLVTYVIFTIAIVYWVSISLSEIKNVLELTKEQVSTAVQSPYLSLYRASKYE